MKAFLLPVLLTFAACGRCGASKAEVTPLQKVVQLLQDMITKAKEEKHEEALQFAAFSQFCSDVTAEKSKAVEEADETIGQLRADIQLFDTEADRLGIEIKGHIDEMSQLEKDTEAAIATRHSERTEYVAMHTNLTESVHALEKAISALKAQAFDREGVDPNSAALLQQVQSSVPMPKEKGRALQAFLSEGEEPDLSFAPPTVPTTAYKFRSDDIIKMLEDLEAKFRDELHQLEADEVSRDNAFNVLTQDLKAASDAAEAARSRKATNELKNRQNSNAASADLTEVSKEREDDFKYLTDLNQTCTVKSDEFHSREQLREEEISALGKAVEILTAEAVAGTAKKHLPSALVQRRKQALLQLRGGDAPNKVGFRVASFLREASERLHSSSLAALAVRANADPFGKVKQLIEELIKRLMHEATEEAEHKGWCDTELSTNAHTRKTKTEEIDTLRSEIDGLNANIAQLGKDLTELAAEITAIEGAVAEATDIRNNETAENNATVVEAQAAQVAVANAQKVLKDFYAKAGEATALVQRQGQPEDSRPAPPPVFDSPYKGLQAESGGVLGMLEVIAADFARLEKDTVAAEEAARAEYNGFMEDSSISKAQKESGIKHKEQDKRGKEQTLGEKSEQLTQAEQVLGVAELEYEKLKPACINTGQTYEERVARRKDEIEALKEALRILSDQDFS